MGGAKEELMRFTVLNELAKTDQMSTADAIQLLNVSESTVRRLFAKLEACHDVIRVYGGIRANRSQNSYQYDRFYSHEQEAKSVIGNIAGNLVANSDCIFIDCGTTTVHMSSYTPSFS